MHVFVRFKLKNVQILVEVTGLEPTTSWSRRLRAKLGAFLLFGIRIRKSFKKAY